MSAAAAMPRDRPGRQRRAEIDELTLARARRGERAACTRFVAVHEAAVFAVIGRVLGPRAHGTIVEDLAQEAFVRALRALPRFDPSGPARLSTWVITIATRVALSELRRARPATGEIDEAHLPPVIGEHLRADRRRALARAIADLTDEQRAVFVLRDGHGFTETEVAEALEIEVAAVKSRLVRARARLRRSLGEDGDV